MEGAAAIDLRLVDPGLDFWIDVRVRRLGSRWVVVADLASTPEVGVSPDLDLAMYLSLWPLGVPIARQMAEPGMSIIEAEPDPIEASKSS